MTILRTYITWFRVPAKVINKYVFCVKSKFSSSLDILDEMRFIRCVEHNGKMKFITPFVGKQIDIAKALGFEIPEGCGKKYKSKRVKTKKGPGRPRKQKEVNLDS